MRSGASGLRRPAAVGGQCFLFVGPARPAAAAEALAASAAVVAAGQWILLARTLRQERGCEATQAA
jgi:hypothetical protein